MTWCSAASTPSARPAATSPAWRPSPPATATSVPGVQINRFCASGLDAVNLAAAQVMAGQQDLVIGGGVEAMSRVGIGASGGAWPVDPSIAMPAYFMPQGVSADLIATAIRLHAATTSTPMRWKARSARRGPGTSGRFDQVGRAGHGRQRPRPSWPATSTCGPPPTMQSLAQLKPSFAQMGEMGGFDAVGDPGASGS